MPRVLVRTPVDLDGVLALAPLARPGNLATLPYLPPIPKGAQH